MRTALLKAKYRRRAIGFFRNHTASINTTLICLTIVMELQASSQPLVHAQIKVAGQSAQVQAVATVTPKPMTDEEYMKSLPYGALVWQTYGHESTWGKNDACKTKRLYNGFGYAEPNDTPVCFSSVREVAQLVSQWFVKHQAMGEDAMLCYYNTGKILNSCGYANYTKGL